MTVFRKAMIVMVLLGMNALVALPVFSAEVQAARVWKSEETTRIVFDLSAKVQYKVALLENPTRLKIDLSDTKQIANFSKLQLKETAISQVKGIQKKADLAITLILRDKTVSRNAIDYKSFFLKPSGHYGNRLVIDIGEAKKNQSILNKTVKSRETFAVEETYAIDKEDPEAELVQQARLNKAKTPQQRKSLSSSVAKEPSGVYRDIIIAIDAGHGGNDPGAIGPGGIREKQVVLAMAKQLYKLVNRQYGMKAILIRDGDYFIPLKQRRDKAREHQADLFVSIHADSAMNKTASGSSVYALSERGATSESAKWLARKENESDLIGGVDLNVEDNVLKEVLIDLSMTASMAASLEVGRYVLDSLGSVNKLHYRRVEQAGFMVLKSPDMPSILIETGYISNPHEAKKLSSAEHQQKIVRAIMRGIKSYFDKHTPSGSYLALQK